MSLGQGARAEPGDDGERSTATQQSFVAHVNTSAAHSSIDGHFLSLALGSWDKLAQGPGHHLAVAATSVQADAHTSSLAWATTMHDKRPAPSRIRSFPFITCDQYFDRDPRLLEYLKPLAPGYLRFGDVSYFYGGVGDGDQPIPAVAGFGNVTISRECFDRVASFAEAAGTNGERNGG